MNPLYLIAEIHPDPSKLDQARAAYQELILETLKEPGCLLYDLVAEEDSSTWFMLEKWQSQAAWELHMETEHVKHINQTSAAFSYKETRLRFLTNV